MPAACRAPPSGEGRFAHSAPTGSALLAYVASGADASPASRSATGRNSSALRRFPIFARRLARRLPHRGPSSTTAMGAPPTRGAGETAQRSSFRAIDRRLLRMARRRRVRSAGRRGWQESASRADAHAATVRAPRSAKARKAPRRPWERARPSGTWPPRPAHAARCGERRKLYRGVEPGREGASARQAVSRHAVCRQQRLACWSIPSVAPGRYAGVV